MAARHVVVDGSNLATEGRSMPSLAQLDQAVREFLLENPDDVVTVVVDASFGHRIDNSESKMFEEAEAAGELVSPPAGAIGRGDAFLLRIADKTGATVLSNDSFQEFHGDYDWLFERGRLIGGKPVPGVGWIFTPRTPVRGPRSREAVKEAKRKTKGEPESAMPGLDLAAERSRTKGKGKRNVERAIAVALEEVVAPKDKPRRRRKGGSPPADPVNDPLSFITFIAAHPLGAEVIGAVESFASHGAFVDCGGARCYVPLSGMGEPPPKSAREIFSKGDEVRFVVQALDPQRRGVELALPGFAKVAGAPTEETVAAEIEARADGEEVGAAAAPTAAPAAPARRSRKKAAAQAIAADEPVEVAAVPAAPVMKAPSRRRSPSGAAKAAPASPVEEVAAAPAPAPAPVKKAPTRRRGAAATVPLEGIPETFGPEVAAPEMAAPVKKAPSRRRGAPAATHPVEEAASPSPAPPTKRASKASAGAVAAVPAVPAVPEVPEVAPGPATRSSRRRSRSGATPVTPSAAETPTPIPTPTPATPEPVAVAAPEPAPRPLPAPSAPSARPPRRRTRSRATPGTLGTPAAPLDRVSPVEAPAAVPDAAPARTRNRRTTTESAVPAQAPAPEPAPSAGGRPRARGAAQAVPAESPPTAAKRTPRKKAAPSPGTSSA